MRKRSLDNFTNDQLSRWPLARDNYRQLKGASRKTVMAGGLEVVLQHNPARIVSTAAAVDRSSVQARPCFLCRDNRPPEQISLRFDGRKGRKYDILVNPYPIFPEHLVIAMDRHCDQSIWKRYVDMLDLAKAYQTHVFMYNGPRCGASAPDHHHFQAAGRGATPLERDVDRLLDSVGGRELTYLTSVREAELFHYGKFTRGIFVLKSRTAKSMAKLFYRLLDCAPLADGDSEPKFNLLTWHTGTEYRSAVMLRAKHRPHHYFSTGEECLMLSPGCADMAGFFVVPRAEDYEKLGQRLLEQVLEEVSLSADDEALVIRRLTRTQPLLSVGIMSAPELTFEILSDGAGVRKAVYREGKIEYDGALYDELHFGEQTLSSMFAGPDFVLHDVVIGVGFHWERHESQTFAGALRIVVSGDKLLAINVIGVEDYLLSVISSEMKSTASVEFLKAHAVISRSWVMSMIASRRAPAGRLCPDWVRDMPTLASHLDSLLSSAESGTKESAVSGQKPEYSVLKWYDRTDHREFDVCADDHCQRYQGLTRAVGKTVREAVDATWGEVLTFGGEICDARFSKCCGGMTEKFSTCWEDRDYPYLQPVADPFCCTSDKAVLSQVLNDYDLETEDFYRWTVRYGRQELSSLVAARSGHDLGTIVDMVPEHRGPSGRIDRLRIVGTKASLTVGKELEIRRILSESHLKSSAFDVDFEEDGIVLSGRGWGHGVGLCQIGAAVMASEGYDYRHILAHYYPGSGISRIGSEISRKR